MRTNWLLIAALIPIAGFAGYAEDKKKYDECAAKVRKDYPVPPGNVNALNQLIVRECGNPPQPPKK